MKTHSTILERAALLALTLLSTTTGAQNLVVNGNFDAGNSGFMSQYTFARTETAAGTYDVVYNPKDSHTGATSFTDHTSDTGRMLVANGAPNSDRIVWSQIVTVAPNTTYVFSGWGASWCGDPDPRPPEIRITINGAQIGSPAFVPSQPAVWSAFARQWRSESARSALIELRLATTQNPCNDLALDDLSFATSGPGIIAYENDFSGLVGQEWSSQSTSTTPTGSRRFLGEFSNDRVTLTLSNLPPHGTVKVGFDLFIIRSWDGNNTDFGPDIWEMRLSDGRILLTTTFNNQSEFPGAGADGQSFPEEYNPTNTIRFASFTGATETNTLGFLWPAAAPMDTVYHIQKSFMHTNANLALEFLAIALQGLADESWGLANIIVEVFPPGPVFTQQPQDVEVKLGGTAMFSVQATGSGTLRYQWRFNGARIIGGINPTLTINQVTALDEGDYTVEVTDDLGSVSSAPAHLFLFRDSDGDALSDNFEKGVGRYEIIKANFTWQEAKADAQTRGGHLGTITSPAEWESVKSLLEHRFLTEPRIWLGASDFEQEGTWKWVTGEPWSYNRWNAPTSEPNGGQRENYLDWLPSALNYGWNDESDAPGRGYGYLFERGFYTDPNNADTDGDGFNDGVEYEAGTLPTDPNSRPLPKLLSQPQGTNLVVGGTINLSVKGNGFGSLTYQWRFNGMPILNATNETMTIANSQHAHSGHYDVVLKNTVGFVISPPALVRITPVVDLERLNNGFVILQLLDARPLTWRVESSENLISWQTLGPMTYTDGLGVFLDAAAVGKSRLFYRVVSP